MMIVMRRPRSLLLAASIVVLAAVALLAFRSPQQLIEPELLQVQGFSDAPAHKYAPVPTPCILLRLTKVNKPWIILAQDQAIQFRLKGEWLAPEKLDRLSIETGGGSGNPLPGCMVVLPNHRQAEAFRFELCYRRDSLREAVITWLNRGWWGKAPKLCRWLTDRLPDHRRWRHCVLEMELPKEPWWSAPEYARHFAHNPQGGANGSQPFSSEASSTPAAAASRRSP